MTAPLRVALLTHSTNPRGGVAHALALGDALVDLGFEVVVHAPDASGAGFFRPTRCRTVAVPATPAGSDIHAMVKARVGDYLRQFEAKAHRDFDIFHAGDGISGNALAQLRKAGVIAGFARTVHHIDNFADARVEALQSRSIVVAEEIFAPSRAVRDEIAARFGRPATVVGNGVDLSHFGAAADGRETGLKLRLGLSDGPLFLSVGGVEPRKNTLAIVEAFAQVRTVRPRAQLVIAGGASLLDHDPYRRIVAAHLAASGLPGNAVIETGPLCDADMPALYRIASALVFPSLREGFGLAVLEALASGLPVVVSHIAPFTEFLGELDALWCDPRASASIADAMLMALAEPLRSRLITRGHDIAAAHDWRAVAAAHLAAYARLIEFAQGGAQGLAHA